MMNQRLVALVLIVALVGSGLLLTLGQVLGSDASGTDPDSGLPTISLSDLPAEAGQTLALIEAGGPFPYGEDGATFGNFEGLLPAADQGYYQEFTVETPGSADRGARRIVAGLEGELYWTADHYSSFERITR